MPRLVVLDYRLAGPAQQDGNRNRMGNVAECGAILRHVVMNLLGRDPNPEKRSIRRRRLQAALSPDYRMVRRQALPPWILAHALSTVLRA